MTKELETALAEASKSPDVAEVMREIKSQLAHMSKVANRWPQPETNVVDLHPPEQLSDDEKRCYADAVFTIWPLYQRLEIDLIKSGVLNAQIRLPDEEENELPF